MKNTNTLGWKLQLCTGAALAAMSVAAVRVDILNNYEYGVTVSNELATVLVLAAFGVVAIPTAASILGWSKNFRITTAMCVALTVWSAINAYSAKQGADILAAQSTQDRYQHAQGDEKLARQTLASIKEVGNVEELGKIQKTLTANMDRACKHPRSDACKLAQSADREITLRVSDAKTREKAEETLSKAKEEAKVGPAEASMVATVISSYTQYDASQVARLIALSLTGLGIMVTQLVALMGGQAASLIASGLRNRPSKLAKVGRKNKPVAPTDGGSRQTAPSNVIKLDAAKHSVQAWINKSTTPGASMRGGDALKAYKRYAGRMAKDMTAAELKSVLGEILGHDAIIQKTSGFSVHGIELKITQRQEKKLAFC